MTTDRQHSQPAPSLGQKGVALVTTLSLIALLSLSLVSYFALMAHSRSRARGFTTSSRAQMLLEIATQEALAKIMDGGELYNPNRNAGRWNSSKPNTLTATAHSTACPGMISVRYFDLPFNPSESFDNRSANPWKIPLFSWKSSTFTNTFDINTLQNPFQPGEFYLSGYPEQSNAVINVHWLPVYKDSTQPPSENNPIIGRYAYWIDVENSKINLNAATRPLNASEWVEATNETEAEIFNWWFPWSTTKRPHVADNSLVHWQSITAIGQHDGANQRVENVLTNYLDRLERSETSPFAFWPEIYSLFSPQNPSSDRAVLATVRKTLALSTTLYGHDEECDPIGQSKIDLLKFLANSQQYMSGPEWSELTNRLMDSYYHQIYFPTNTGAAKSLAQSLNGFGGDGNPQQLANGLAALKQMMVNIVEYSKDHAVAPYLDRNSGIIGVKSIPYVVEVVTRARSALWLLDERDRNFANFISNGALYTNYLRATTPESSTFQKLNLWFLTNSIVDLTISLLNPNLLTNNSFNGTLSFNYRWSPSLNSQVTGKETNRNLPADFLSSNFYDPWTETDGTIYFYLGTVPGDWLTNRPTALQIQGWQIKKGNNIFHEVPFPYPGQSPSDVSSWWEMAQANCNVGNQDDYSSFHTFQTNGQRRAIGWFTPKSYENVSGFALTNIFLDPRPLGFASLEAGMDDLELIGAISNLIRSTTTTNTNSTRISVIQRVVCIDPALGHRTGNPRLTGIGRKSGHFYGALGHPWRYYDPDNTNIARMELRDPGGRQADREMNGGSSQILANEEETPFQPRIKGSWMTSVGELGFVHSGWMQRAIPLTAEEGESPYSFNFPGNGPPIRMLLDLFTPPAYHNKQTDAPLSRGDWENLAGSYQSNSPQTPRRGTWNFNTTIASADGLQNSFNSLRGFDAWLSLIKESATNSSVPFCLKHFNSDAEISSTNLSSRMSIALTANQVTTAANAFTAHIVAQLIRDNGKKRSANSGIGYMDPDDEILSEQWAQIIIGRRRDDAVSDPDTLAPFQNQYSIIHYNVLENPK